MDVRNEEEPARKNTLRKEDIEKVLQEIERPFAFVGVMVPEVFAAGGVQLRLQSILYEMARKKRLTQEDVEAVINLLNALQKRKKELTDAIRDSKTQEELQRYRAEALGIIRAISEFSELTDGVYDDYKDVNRTQNVEDAKRWLNYLKQIK